VAGRGQGPKLANYLADQLRAAGWADRDIHVLQLWQKETGDVRLPDRQTGCGHLGAELAELGEFDTTTSSWVQTPATIRKLGGALFCDRRYDTVFVYHNGAESYYAGRGFRCSLRV
jgi:hypothetical protein